MTDPALNVAATRDIATRILDPSCPLYADAATGGERKYGFDDDYSDHGLLTTICRQARSSFNPQAPLDDAVLAHALALARRLHLLGVMPLRESEEHIQELQWGRIRCLFAGLGHVYHQPIFALLHEITPWCPVDPTEDLTTWQTRYVAAHETSGWPITLLLVPYAAFRTVCPATEAPQIETWHALMAEAHILKHLRLDERRDGQLLVSTYAGEAHTIEAVRGMSLLVTKLNQPWLSAKLGAKAPAVNAMDKAVSVKLGQMPPSALLQRQPLSELPPQVFVSPAARLAPSVADLAGYFQHGLTLQGVKVALGGQVRDYGSVHGSSSDILGFQWPAAWPAGVEPTAEARWLAAVPTTYNANDWPSDVLARYFPNFLFLSPAHRALFDAVFCAQVCRGQVPKLGVEFPAICVMPSDATPLGSTKQGKSTCAKALLHALAPAADYIQTSGTDNISLRALNWRIADAGTVGFDEFRLSANPVAPTHRDRLPALCTGGEVDVPVVRENRGTKYRLKAPLVISAKYIDLPDDLQNRFLLFWMDRLPESAWADQNKFFEAESGALAALLRLAALGQAEAHDLVAGLNEQPVASTEAGFRYPMHRLLAAGILAVRMPELEGAAAFTAVDACVAEMALRQAAHMVQAEDSHLVSMVEEGAAASRLSVDALVDTLDEIGLTTYAMKMQAKGGQTSYLRPTQLLACRAETYGQQLANEPLAKALAPLLPQALHTQSDRMLANALSHSLKVRFTNPAPDGSIALPGAHGLNGWRMRMDVSSTSPRFRIYNDNPSHVLNRPGNKLPIAKPT